MFHRIGCDTGSGCSAVGDWKSGVVQLLLCEEGGRLLQEAI